MRSLDVPLIALPKDITAVANTIRPYFQHPRDIGLKYVGKCRPFNIRKNDIYIRCGAEWCYLSFDDGWCPKMYAASNKSVVDIEKSDGKCLNVIEHLLGKTAGFTHRTAYPLA